MEREGRHLEAIAARLRRAGRWLVLGDWRRFLLRLLVLGALGGSAAFLAVWIGFAPISASAGHWPITDWFLHFAMRQAVDLRSSTLSVPPLDDPADQLKGAGHYASGCAPCHGAPGETPALVTQGMTPPPPFLPARIREWQAEELFWIVQHGVKFTGMPAWASQSREDEVWAMVAFLQLLPELTPAQYRRLAFGEAAVEELIEGEPGEAQAGGAADALRSLTPLGEALTECARCHGAEGEGRGTGAFPRLAGLHEDYLLATLRAYADGQRDSGMMQPVAAALDETEMARLAEHFAALPAGRGPSAPEEEVDTEAIERGRLLAERGSWSVPSCRHCHGPGTEPRNTLYPDLAGQYEDYLYLQLKLFAEGGRGGTEYVELMEKAVEDLDDGQMRDLASYYASLSPEPEAAVPPE